MEVAEVRQEVSVEVEAEALEGLQVVLWLKL